MKDNIITSELPTTIGTTALRGLRPTANAPSLQGLLNAGAILLGKSNMHELAFGITNANFLPFAGTTHNLYDTSTCPAVPQAAPAPPFPPAFACRAGHLRRRLGAHPGLVLRTGGAARLGRQRRA